jgi:CelD/BcsL family acetyltransferase involved in cellulose biosynthesis
VATLADPSLPAVRDDWSRLAQESGSIFATPEWLLSWWRHFGGGRELLLSVEPDAVLPFYVWRERPLRIVRVLGHGPGDELGPFGPGAREALGRWVETERFDVLACQQLPGPESWLPALPGGVLMSKNGSPVLEFEGRTWEELLKGKSRNFREQVGRRARALERDYDGRFRLVTDMDQDALDTFFRLHALRHDGETVITRTEAFQREFAAIAAERGWLRLWLLELDGRPAAAWLGYRFAGAECYYQAGRDPAFDKSSVSFVLLAHTIRAALEDGANEYRFLRGDEPYKYRFASSDPGLETVVVARGAVARTTLGALRLLRRMPIRRA